VLFASLLIVLLLGLFALGLLVCQMRVDELGICVIFGSICVIFGFILLLFLGFLPLGKVLNSTTHIPKQEVLQTQAYILLYRISDSRVEPDRTKGPSPPKREQIASTRSPYYPKEILETNGRILYGPENKHRILDT